MPKKTVVTFAEIEKDIINVLKQPEKSSEEAYKKWTVPSVLIALILIVVCIFSPTFALWFLLACLALLIVFHIVSRVRLKRKIKHVSEEDYEITVETVHSITDEHYEARVSRRRKEVVNNYILRFENGACWQIPSENNYQWIEEGALSDWNVYGTAHRGDTFIVVTQKEPRKIVMAYHTDFFEYKP